jgi:hypothetical protein
VLTAITSSAGKNSPVFGDPTWLTKDGASAVPFGTVTVPLNVGLAFASAAISPAVTRLVDVAAASTTGTMSVAWTDFCGSAEILTSAIYSCSVLKRRPDSVAMVFSFSASKRKVACD